MYGHVCEQVVMTDGSREYRFLKGPQIEQMVGASGQEQVITFVRQDHAWRLEKMHASFEAFARRRAHGWSSLEDTYRASIVPVIDGPRAGRLLRAIATSLAAETNTANMARLALHGAEAV